MSPLLKSIYKSYQDPRFEDARDAEDAIVVVMDITLMCIAYEWSLHMVVECTHILEIVIVIIAVVVELADLSNVSAIVSLNYLLLLRDKISRK
jgi:hypothetical protein